MSQKQSYHEFCINHQEQPIFLQDWWLDAVSVGKEWEVVAGMPCLVRSRMGVRYVVMPQQTQIGGLYMPLDAEKGDAEACASDIAAALKKMRLAYYYQQFPIGSPIPQLLGEQGFVVKQRVTYRIEDLSDLEAVRRRFSSNKRRQLRKAESLLVDTLSPRAFYDFHVACLREQGKEISYSWALLDSLQQACTLHDAAKIIAIKDANGALHAAVMLVYDSKTCYYLIPCYSPTYKDSGAGARLVWESILLAASRGLAFDFEGSMIPGVANHYRQFGSVPTPYCSVEKFYNPLFRLALLINALRNRKK